MPLPPPNAPWPGSSRGSGLVLGRVVLHTAFAPFGSEVEWKESGVETFSAPMGTRLGQGETLGIGFAERPMLGRRVHAKMREPLAARAMARA